MSEVRLNLSIIFDKNISLLSILQPTGLRGGHHLTPHWTGAGGPQEHQVPELSHPSQPSQADDLCYGRCPPGEHRATLLSKCPS